MPLTQSDLLKWEQEKDIAKFIQIFKYLDDDNFIKVRVLTVKALSRLRDIRGLESLIQATNDDSDIVAELARKELITWGTEDIETLCRFVEDENKTDHVRFLGLRIISDIPCDRVYQTYFTLLKREQWVGFIRDIVRNMDSLEPFTSRFQDIDPSIRFATILAFGKTFQNPVVLGGFIKALSDNDVQVSSMAAWAIAYEIDELSEQMENKFEIVPYKNAVEPLIQNLIHEDFMVRAMAAKALGKIRDQRAAEGLLSLLNDLNENVRYFSVVSISKIPNENAFKRLSEMYQTENNLEMRKAVILAISTSPHGDVFSYLKNIINTEKQPELREEAIRGIVLKKTEQTFDVLVNLINEGDPQYISTVLRSLEELNDPRTAEMLLGLLVRDDDRFNIFTFGIIIQALGNLKERRAIESLIILLGKGNRDRIESLIIKTIRKILEPESIEQYIANLPLSKNETINVGLQKLKENLLHVKFQFDLSHLLTKD